jgi:hypothetical protein
MTMPLVDPEPLPFELAFVVLAPPVFFAPALRLLFPPGSMDDLSPLGLTKLNSNFSSELPARGVGGYVARICACFLFFVRRRRKRAMRMKMAMTIREPMIETGRMTLRFGFPDDACAVSGPVILDRQPAESLAQ